MLCGLLKHDVCAQRVRDAAHRRRADARARSGAGLQMSTPPWLQSDYVAFYLPFVVYDSVEYIAGCLCLVLSETLHRQWPQTLENGINFGITHHAQIGKFAAVN